MACTRRFTKSCTRACMRYLSGLFMRSPRVSASYILFLVFILCFVVFLCAFFALYLLLSSQSNLKFEDVSQILYCPDHVPN